MDIKFEDLYVTCVECDGSGTKQIPPAGSTTFGQRSAGGTRPCDACNGQGGRMTASGQALLKFIELAEFKHLRGN